MVETYCSLMYILYIFNSVEVLRIIGHPHKHTFHLIPQVYQGFWAMESNLYPPKYYGPESITSTLYLVLAPWHTWIFAPICRLYPQSVHCTVKILRIHWTLISSVNKWRALLGVWLRAGHSIHKISLACSILFSNPPKETIETLPVGMRVMAEKRRSPNYILRTLLAPDSIITPPTGKRKKQPTFNSKTQCQPS